MWTTCRRLLAAWAIIISSPALSAPTERVITAEELRQFNPQSIERIQPQVSTAQPAASSTIRNLALPGSSVTGSAVSRVPLPDIRIKPTQYLALKSTDPARAVECAGTGSGKCTETPVRFLAMTSQGSPLNLSLVLASSGTLRFDSDSQRFIGNVFVQLRDLDAPGQVKKIGTSIRVAVNADVDDIKPTAMVAIDRTNSFSDVTLEASAPRDPTVVVLTPERLAEPQKIRFGVTRPTLRVEVGQDSILGYGLETAPVIIHAEGDAPVGAVTVTSRTGRIGQSSISFDPSTGIATTFIRSRGTGRDTVSASLGPFAPATDSIEYVQPWSWLVAVLLGVGVGVGIRLAMRAKQHPPRTGIGFNIAIGCIGGVITAALYALGVNILPLPLPGGFSEVLAFVVSALGGWVFPRWLEALGPKRTAEGG